MQWSFAATDRVGANRAFLEARGFELTRRQNSFADARFSLDRQGDAAGKAAEVQSGSRALAAWRETDAGVQVMFRGQIHTPVDEMDGDSASVTATAADPIWWLQHRYVRSDVTFTGQDAGSGIAWPLISTQNGYETTHLASGVIDSSVNRDRTYQAGQQVGDALSNLANVENGFFFKARPVDGLGATFALLDVSYPNSGVYAPGAVFEFGRGTAGTIDAVPTIEEAPPVNRVTVFGDSSATVPAVAQDVASIATYGLVERIVTFSDVVVQATLQAYANELLRPEPAKTFSFSCAPSPLSPAPLLGVDFNVGDTVRVRVDEWRASIDATCRVIAATVAVDDDGRSERLSSVVVEEV